MADKSFGVKEINLIGASGTPSIQSPNNLNLDAVTVAISTDVTIGGQVTSNVDINGDVNVSGVSTFTIGGAGNTEAVYFRSKTEPLASLKISQATGNDYGVLMTFSSFDGDTATIETDSNSNLVIGTQSSLTLRANTNQTVLQSGGSSTDLYYSGIKKFETTGAGVTVTGTTFTDKLSVSGIATAIGGFVSTANTTPVTITWSGSNLTFSVAGIGSTTLTLS